MSIFRWEPGKTEEVMQQRAEENIPSGMRILNEWTGLGGNEVFRWIDVDDPMALLPVMPGVIWVISRCTR